MYPLQDKDLDRLSREAAEQFEVEPGGSGWEHLEKRLDRELPQKKDRRRFLFWLFFISLATGGTLVAILKNKVPATTLANNEIAISTPASKTTAANSASGINNSNAANEETAIKTDATVKNNTTNTSPVVTTDKTQPAQNGQPVTTQQQAAQVSKQTIAGTGTDKTNQKEPSTGLTQQTTPDDQKDASASATGNKTAGNKKTKTVPTVIHQQPVGLNYALTGSDKNSLKNNRNRYNQPKQKHGRPQRTGNDLTAQSPRDNNINNTTSGKDLATNNPVTEQPTPVESPDKSDAPAASNANTTPDPATATDKNTTAPAVVDSAAKPAAQLPAKKEEPKKPHNYKQPLEIGLLAGPDASTVSFGSLYKAGYNFGLQVGYRFNNRWSVNTAIIYTKKFYKADSQYFHPKNNWGGAWKPSDVDGNCAMWEIPVNVRYDVAYNDKRRWFVSTGLSTYLMKSENYSLNFRSMGGGIYSSTYKSDSNSNYIFSILNLSVGFERSLGKHFSIQAEPYLKIPMKGLGYGNMRMDSYGALFSLKYKPTFRSKYK